MTDGQSNDERLEKRLSGTGGFDSAAVLDRAPLVKKSVARVWHDAGPGSGVLLPDNWFLTNHHVLPTEEMAKDAVAQFDYERQPDGCFTHMKQFHFAPQEGFHTSPLEDGDDWTVVKLKGDANAEFGAINLEDVAPTLREMANIVQHPDAGPKQIANGEIVEILDSPYRRIRYRASTLPGSSGAPVFNRRWQVVGLHHSGATTRDEETGEFVECNQGIHIAALLEGLNRVGIWPHQPASGDIQLPDGSWSMERKADREAFKHLSKLRITVALKGGSQMGKSFIAERVARQMLEKGWKTLVVDLRHEFAADDYQTGHGFLRRLAQKIADETNADHALLAAFDNDGTPTAFRTFMENLKAGRPDYRLLITLDRVDALSRQPCCSPVLSGLRVLHNTQTQLGGDAWLQMILIHTITPRQTGALGSIFDVAKVVEVTDFSEGELQKLASLYKLNGVNTSKLHAFLGGHPTLSQLTFMAMIDDNQTLDEVIRDSTRGGIFKQHLDRLTSNFREHPDKQRVGKSFCELVQGNSLDSEETFDALLALGAVKGTFSGDAVARCELYKAWLQPRIPR